MGHLRAVLVLSLRSLVEVVAVILWAGRKDVTLGLSSRRGSSLRLALLLALLHNLRHKFRNKAKL